MKPDALDKADVPRAAPRTADHAICSRSCRSTTGSISAEHGIGLLKKPYLGYSRSPEELALLRAIKRALDPHGHPQPGQDLRLMRTLVFVAMVLGAGLAVAGCGDDTTTRQPSPTSASRDRSVVGRARRLHGDRHRAVVRHRFHDQRLLRCAT